MQNKLRKIKGSFKKCFQTPVVNNSNIFGIPLETLWRKHGGEPVFLQISFDYLRQKALNETRVFRDKPDMEEYKEFINLCEAGNINELQQQNNQYSPSTIIVAWFIRKFLFKLPIPLIPNQYDLSQRLLNAIDVKLPDVFIQMVNDQYFHNNQQNDNNQQQFEDGILDELLYIKSLIMSLKSEHFYVLRCLIQLFHQICSHQMEDKYESIDAHHLAQIFGPILIGLKLTNSAANTKKLSDIDSRNLDLSQDLCLFLINHYFDIFERNTFKEIVYVHRTNKQLQIIQFEKDKQIENLEKIRNNMTMKLYQTHYNPKLKSRLFLAWKANVPRNKSNRKQYSKLQQLKNTVEVQKEIIEKQTKKIKALQTKLELEEFDRTLIRSSQSFVSLLNETPTSTNHIVGGNHKKIDKHEAVDEFLRKSIRQISNIKNNDRTMTKDASYGSLLGSQSLHF